MGQIVLGHRRSRSPKLSQIQAKIGSVFWGHFLDVHQNRSLIGWKWWQEPELNRRHKDFQSSALPTELSCQPKRLFN